MIAAKRRRFEVRITENNTRFQDAPLPKIGHFRLQSTALSRAWHWSYWYQADATIYYDGEPCLCVKLLGPPAYGAPARTS